MQYLVQINFMSALRVTGYIFENYKCVLKVNLFIFNLGRLLIRLDNG